ncbi:MsnO8 family LLM class oxidoreductase [Pseudonocardia alni]|uniref:MsnO8 family LLM class oxidoreductase n=1 Tax=Pseudonocardia alni TaxID=33907 RepID=UPI00280B7E8F|nr:MsnO8 family LLM class oxidoreductase [Pseudonocardia alni]
MTVELLDPGVLTVHDTAPIVEGATVRDTLRRSLALARHAEALGYGRYWTAEQHGMRAVAGCAPEVICAAAAASTNTIRIGAAGVLIPSHPPLLVSERFGSLEALYPDRIDLALGRSLGGPRSAIDLIRAERDHTRSGVVQQIDSLIGHFRSEYHDGARSVAGYGYEPQLWILGTSTDSAEMAAERGLPYAFGGHLAPGRVDDAVSTYKHACARAENAQRPRLAVSVSVIAADTSADAQHLAESHRMKVLQRRVHNRRICLPNPDTAARQRPHDPNTLRAYEAATASFVIGDGETVRAQLAQLRDQTGADEIILSTPVFDHEARLHSFELVAGRS